ncbi:MAG: hypothetical protein V1801_00135 [Candidatus Falkowbacteria bacterium]
MPEGTKMSIDEVIAELKKPSGESEFDREELLAHLTFFSWFRNHIGRKAKAYLSPDKITPFVLTKEMLAQRLRLG